MNENIKLQLNKSQLNNLILFLNKVEYKGLDEVQAIQEILSAIDAGYSENENKK